MTKRKKLIEILNFITGRKELIKLFEKLGYRQFEKVAGSWIKNIDALTDKDIEDLIQFLSKTIKAFEKGSFRVKKGPVKTSLDLEFTKPPIPGQMSLLKEKKFKPVSKSKSLIPEAIFKISKKFNITQLKKSDYLGRIETEEYGEMEKWQKKDIGYLVKTKDFFEKLSNQLPKVNANLDKVLKILIYLIQQKANKSGEDITRAKGSFLIKDIVRLMGYKGNEGIYPELRRTLISGGCIIYEYPHKIGGVNYKFYGSWYDIEVPEDNKHEWYYGFRGPYEEKIIKLVNTGQVQYLKHQLKEIADRNTTQKPYLHFFYDQMIFSNLSKRSKKIINLLKDMGIPKKILDRPGECFNMLKDCLIYFNSNYPEELEGFYISAHYDKKDLMQLGISETFKGYNYADFKELLQARGIKDIREAYIRIKKPDIKIKEKYYLNEEENRLLERALKWFDGQVTKIPTADQESQIKMYIKKIGQENYKELFEREANKQNASAVDFLIKVLPAKLKEIKDKKTVNNFS